MTHTSDVTALENTDPRRTAGGATDVFF